MFTFARTLVIGRRDHQHSNSLATAEAPEHVSVHELFYDLDCVDMCLNAGPLLRDT